MLKDPQSTARAMQRNLSSFSVGLPLALVFCVSLWFLPSSLRAQENEQEVVANLAAGRVVLYVARDAIVIGAVEQHRSEEHTSELQSRLHLVCRLLLEKKK